jgi:outer membrane lipopolysaccharide assembly protein LptE/RlpB|tara:strand:- start:699 stop:1163 length:465 start_codon:yes stop_codon:yes gene_type:complete
MLKKYFFLTIFLFLSSCGYEAMHSKKNYFKYDFFISQLDLNGDRDVNLKIKEKLNNYTLNKKDKIFTLKIYSVSEKKVLTKNVSGDPTSFKIIINIKIEVLTKDNLQNSFTIIEDFNYKNNTNKFDLKNYESEIKSNLAETATDKLITKLSNIQ